MRILKHTIWIRRTPEQVFDFFVDFSQAERWRSYVRRMEPRATGPIGPGSRIGVELDLMGGSYAYDLIVVAVERPSLWRHRTAESDFTGHVEYTFAPEDGGTRVTMTMVAKPNNVHGWLAMPLMWLSRNRSYRDQLPALKRVMEE